MEKFNIEFYTKENGEKPAKDFLLSLDKKMRAKLSGILVIMEEYGSELREPYSKYLEDGIFELRGKVGNNISRVMYFFYVGNRIILTNGFIKKHKRHREKNLNWQNNTKKIFLKGLVKIMSEFRDFLDEQLEDKEFREEYENMSPEFDIIRAMVAARKERNMTQKELAEKTGITQADISRIENGTRNPSLDMIKRLAKGMGMRLKLEFISEPTKR